MRKSASSCAVSACRLPIGAELRRPEDTRALGLTGESEDAERTMIEGALAANAPLAIACWRGRSSLAVLVSKPECSLLEEKLSQALARCSTLSKSSLHANPL